MAKRRRGSTQQALDARGEDIARDGAILDIGSNRYLVSSQSVVHAFYDVGFGPDGWRCSCPYHLHGSRRCKHIRAVASIVMSERKLADEGREKVLIGEPCVACRFCTSTDCTERGTRANKSGVVSRYKCNGCGRRFTHNPGFVGRHHAPEVITDALQACATGLSPRKVSEGLAKRGISVSGSTVHRWVCDYGRIIETFQKSGMVVGYTWHVDEIYFRVRGKPMWLFGVMDAETRIIIAYDTAPDKLSYDATGLFEAAVEAAGKRPDVLITYGLCGFKTGYKRAMYTNTTPRTVHIADAGIRDRHATNNPYERLNGEIRDRIARIRGFKSIEPALLRLLIMYHNFIRPHGGLDGRTPAEAAGIAVAGPDKWRTLIGHAALFCV